MGVYSPPHPGVNPPNFFSAQMLKPLVEKRRRDRINRNLEELRLLLLQKTHCQWDAGTLLTEAEVPLSGQQQAFDRRPCLFSTALPLQAIFLDLFYLQTLKNPKVEKAEILELAVGYLQERNTAKPRGTIHLHGEDALEDSGLQTCYPMGFRACFGHLAAFIQHAHPSVQSHLWEGLRVYLTAMVEPPAQDWSSSTLSPSSSSSEEAPAWTPEAFCSPVQLSRTFRRPDPPSSSTGHLGSRQRHPHPPESDASAKSISPLPTFWRPWP
ncbi:transcription factor HES-7 [Python bivittatus]|uniref:Transcription factor HES-7 n=1 Tax=Python bivittatus TaxID=176946 RepID=A0A9F3QUX0_PYTBI|nr:transcription factor HES-7 [Python bivittatus]